MTYHEANRLLDMAKDGLPVPDEVLDEALFLAGDYPHHQDVPCPDMDAFLVEMRKAGLL